MNTPMPAIDDTPEALTALRTAAREARQGHRLQARSRLHTPHARTRRPVARLLGVPRETVGRWRAASARGGLPQRLTMAKAPGQGPLFSSALQPALRARLRQPHRLGRDHAVGHGWRQDDGLAMASNTVHQCVRDPLRAKRQGPRTSPRKTPEGVATLPEDVSTRLQENRPAGHSGRPPAAERPGRLVGQADRRFGRLPRPRRRLPGPGVKPWGAGPSRVENFSGEGAVEPTTGESCFRELPDLHAPDVQRLLQALAPGDQGALHRVLRDQGRGQTATSRVTPPHVGGRFWPP